MSLGRRLAITILGPIALALAACFTAALLLPEHLSRQARDDRVIFRLEALRASTEANLALGLPVTGISVMQDLIEGARRADPGLLAIDIFAAGDGVTLYSTDLGVIGEPVPATWIAAAADREPPGHWSLYTEGEILIGLPVRDDLGDVVAEIASVTAAAEFGGPVVALRRDLTNVALWLVPIVFGLGALAAAGLARRLVSPVRIAVAALRDAAPGGAAVLAARETCLHALDEIEAAGVEIEAIEHVS